MTVRAVSVPRSKPSIKAEILEIKDVAAGLIPGSAPMGNVIIPGLRNRLLVFSVRLSPRVLVTRVAGRLQA
jgi:hypothetical protein